MVEHEVIDLHRLRSRDVYRLMTDLVAPRPIAWVSTVDSDGRRNLAPFSYFQAISTEPPMIVLGIAWHSDGRPKDTLKNILDVREFTVNHVTHALVDAMNQSSGDYDPTTEEWAIANAGLPLASAPAHAVAAPRVADALASLECRMVHAIPLGQQRNGKPSTTMVVAEVRVVTVAAGLVRRDDSGRLLPIDPALLAAVGRLGGIAYTETREPFFLTRPEV